MPQPWVTLCCHGDAVTSPVNHRGLGFWTLPVYSPEPPTLTDTPSGGHTKVRGREDFLLGHKRSWVVIDPLIFLWASHRIVAVSRQASKLSQLKASLLVWEATLASRSLTSESTAASKIISSAAATVSPLQFLPAAPLWCFTAAQIPRCCAILSSFVAWDAESLTDGQRDGRGNWVYWIKVWFNLSSLTSSLLRSSPRLLIF